MQTASRISGVLLLLCLVAAAPPQRAVVRSALNYTALQAGQQATIAVVLDVKAGFHSQSHTPLASNLIPFEVSFQADPKVEFGQPIYPKGQIVDFPALGKMSVYEGRVVAYVPVTAKKDAAVGELKLKGTATYQVCDDRSCYAPESPAIDIDTQIIPPGQTLQPNQPELFSSFDPSTFATAAPDVTLFGWTLTPDGYGLAFAGAIIVGILFNVMPCVLPIVPLKAMGFYQAGQEHRGKSMALGAVFALGIVATFGALAVPVVVLRTFAWGELFGNPIFAAVIVIILIAMALGTFGAFSVVLPTKVYQFAPKHDTYIGNFLFGILTAVLSTPCTFGMFLGLLVWASAQPPVIGTSLVMCVGLGMALPYLVLAGFPQLAKNFPRTGPWAEIVKQMMGFLLLATAVYFSRRFLPESLGDHGFWWVLFAVIAASGIFLIARTLQFTRRAVPVTVAVVIAFLLVAPALAITLRLTYSPVHWIKYSPEALKSAQDSGKPVLLEFTAKWCGNCQAIEATVYVDARTVEAIEKLGVVPLEADLTDRNAPGWDLLRTLHPVGAIPFTAIYLPGKSEPQKLAGIYTTDDLLKAINQINHR